MPRQMFIDEIARRINDRIFADHPTDPAMANKLKVSIGQLEGILTAIAMDEQVAAHVLATINDFHRFEQKAVPDGPS